MATFNFSFDPGTSIQQMTGFEVAGRIWSTYLKDNTTLNIHVGVSSSLPTGVIGGALPGIRSAQKYKDVVRGLESDATSRDDTSSVNGLNIKADYEARFDNFDLKDGKNKGSVVKTKSINITSANAKSINLGGGNASDLDGVILLSDLSQTNLSWNYDFTRTTTITRRSVDFLSTAMHEIAHILGFVSGVDKPGWLSSKASDKGNADLYKKSLEERIANTTTLDLFRYSSVAGEGVNDLSYGSIGSDKFFSVDGGKTSIAQFATGENRALGGDGEQASHWKNQLNPLGIMSPTLDRGVWVNISAIDLRALDVIGWDVDVQGVTSPIDWSTIVSQAKQSLASRVGQTVNWLETQSDLAARSLSQNRDQDISKMIAQSQVYKWDPGEDDPFWQKIQALYFQEGLFQTIAPLSVANDRPSVEIQWGSRSEEPQAELQAMVYDTQPGVNAQSLSSPLMDWVGFEVGNSPVNGSRSYRQIEASGTRKRSVTPTVKQQSELQVKGLDLI